ncbi:MAG: glycosyltransferase [Cyanobacteria bacterium J06621_8]
MNYNSSNLIARLADSLLAYNLSEYQLIIVNNSPEDRDVYRLKNPQVKIIEAQNNLGFGKACNLGLSWIYQQDQQAVVWLINPDAYFALDVAANQKSPLDLAIAFFQNHPQISILGTVVRDAQGEITAAGGTFTPGKGSLSVITALPETIDQDYWQTDWVSGCSLMINLTNFAELPYFNPRYFLYYEDLDFCLRYGQQGHQIAVTNLITVNHDTSSITDRNLKQKFQHITRSYLIHMEKHSNLSIFIVTNIRMILNTFRLIFIKPQQGRGKLIGILNYWQERLKV